MDQETHPTVKAEILDISVQQDMLWTMDAQYSFCILSIFYYMLLFIIFLFNIFLLFLFNIHFVSRMISHLGVGSWLMKNCIWLGKVPFIQKKENTIFLFQS